MSDLTALTDADIGSVTGGVQVPIGVLFVASWCRASKKVMPDIEQLWRELPCFVADIDLATEAASRAAIVSVPCLVLYRAGEIIGRKVGAWPLLTLKTWVEDVLRDSAAGKVGN